jgi:hypothetical protein
VQHNKFSIGTLIALAATGLFLSTLTSSTIISGTVISSQSINSGGSITSINVEIFSDSECTQSCTSLNWGTITPGETITQTIYVKNNGNRPIVLSMITQNWTPTNASNYISLSWNRQSSSLNPGEYAEASLTLIIASDTGSITDFNFDIIINGIEN